MIRSIFGTIVIATALLITPRAAAADDEQQTGTCPASVSLPFAVPAATGASDATITATLASGDDGCAGTFDVAVGGATVGTGKIRLTQEGSAIHARVRGSLASDAFSGTFRAELETSGDKGRLDAVFCNGNGSCRELETAVPLPSAMQAPAPKGMDTEDEEEDDD